MKCVFILSIALIAIACVVSSPKTPSDEAIQTDTPAPTDTPEPTTTNTPIPFAPSCTQILLETDGMTDVQWDVYKKDFKGLWVDNWEGEVAEVGKEFLGSNFNVHVETLDGCTILVQVNNETTALTFSRGDLVFVSGVTSSLSDVFGKLISLDDDRSSIYKK